MALQPIAIRQGQLTCRCTPTARGSSCFVVPLAATLALSLVLPPSVPRVSGYLLYRSPAIQSKQIAMKLAEALVLRSDHQSRVSRLESRLLRVAQVQEGDEPAEDPVELIAEFEEVAAELEVLIQRINQTNLATRLPSGATLTEALATRDVLNLRAAMYRKLAESATVSHERYSRSEVKFVGTVDVRTTQKQADAISKQHRELDAEIQAANWLTPLAGLPVE